MLIGVLSLAEIDIVYGPEVAEAVLVFAFEETIGEIRVNEKKEKAAKAIKTLTFERSPLLCTASFTRIPTS